MFDSIENLKYKIRDLRRDERKSALALLRPANAVNQNRKKLRYNYVGPR